MLERTRHNTGEKVSGREREWERKKERAEESERDGERETTMEPLNEERERERAWVEKVSLFYKAAV